jgi:hypothetical protein
VDILNYLWPLVIGIALHGVLMAQPAGEYEIKAAFLYKVAGFVQWPDDRSGGAIAVCVTGEDPFGSLLDEAIKGKSLNGRPFTVMRFRKGQEVSGCPMVFIAASERKRLDQILRSLPPGVLTVGDMPGFCESGGMIAFDLRDSRVHLRINLEAARRARLQFSSKLLSLAKVVGDGGP